MFEFTKQMSADLDTPVSTFLKLQALKPIFLLESVEGGEMMGRYSFIGLGPLLDIEVQPGQILCVENGQRTVLEQDPFEFLRQTLLRFGHGPTQPELPRFAGGLVGFVGYDMVRFIEKLPQTTRQMTPLPLAAFYVPSVILVFDHVQRKIKLICAKDQPKAAELAGNALELLRAPLKLMPPQASAKPVANKSREQFYEDVIRAKNYITSGDIFQVVLSIRFEGETAADPFQVYRALRMVNPSPYMYYLDFGRFQIVGSSPETLVKLEEGRALLRPIAGTRPRGKTSQEDQALEKELLADEKERAEHLMLVDLARNDLGRVAQPGTVTVSDFFKVERYSHVMHIVSSVEAQVQSTVNMVDLFKAVFPAGTVSGAPKIRAMEIIAELEGESRGPYAGSVGYFGFNGNMDHAITLRTVLFADGKYYIQAGVGIVADSQPQREYEEITNKARALFRALELVEEGL